MSIQTGNKVADTAIQIGEFLIEHADLVDDIREVFASGGTKEAVRKAIRSVKVAISDQAMREEIEAAKNG